VKRFNGGNPGYGVATSRAGLSVCLIRGHKWPSLVCTLFADPQSCLRCGRLCHRPRIEMGGG
jgi:hypothetical protein